MKKIRFITTLILAFTFVFAQVGNVMAAPSAQGTTPITGTIESITVEPGTDGADPTVLITFTNGTSYRLSVDTAKKLNLLIVNGTGDLVLDENGLPMPDETQIGSTREIDPDDVILDEPVHPISAILASFFDVDPTLIDESHEDGFGFGLIAQALWMAKNLGGDITFADILDAKKSGDYSAFTLPDGTIPTNWGQFKKLVSEKKNNLGSVVSGQADDDAMNPGNGNGGGNGQGNGNGQGQGNGNGQGQGNGNGQGQDNGNGHGKGNKKPKP